MKRPSTALRDGGIKVSLGDGGMAERTELTEISARFRIPLSYLPRNASRMTLSSFEVTYTTPNGKSWPFEKRGTETGRIQVITLPTELGRYEGQAFYKKRGVRMTVSYTMDLKQFRDSNTDVVKVAYPKEGWRWDLSQPPRHEESGADLAISNISTSIFPILRRALR